MVVFKQLGRYGRIGNQMFQVASTIGIATRHGFDFGFPKWQNYDQLERFGGGEDIDIQRWFVNPLPDMADGSYRDHNVHWGYHDVKIRDWTNLIGHMQSERYFSHCADTVRHYLKFANETEPMRDTVAVHYRAGDYGGDYHPRCTAEYYRQALDRFGGKTILLFSDDPDEAYRVIGQGEPIRGNHSMTDLQLMTKCDYHIIANSTFSWWGAWLSGSTNVVAPSVWFGPAARHLETKDIYPANWTVL
jgi:hypothetical protein